MTTEQVGKGMNSISPGGRPADASSLDRSPKKNWVENAGGLPRYVRMVANALMRERGMTRSRAIAIAISKMKKWAAGGDGVSPKVQAAAAKAVAEWEAKKAKSGVSKSEADFDTWMEMAALLKSEVEKARGPVDGDGDGFVYDGTPRKRPATPAERAAGARLRAKQRQAGRGGAGAAKKAAAPAKKAAAKGPARSPRFKKFDRAINQAIRAKDKREIRDVERYIRADLELKPDEKKDLLAILAARRDGLPDPAPGGAAPAKKAAAPRAAAKKPGAIREAAAKTPELDLRRRAAKKAARSQPPAKKTVDPAIPDTADRKAEYGRKMQELLDGGAFASAQQYVDDLHRNGRINDEEHAYLRDKIDKFKDRRRAGVPQGGVASALARNMQGRGGMRVKRQSSFERDHMGMRPDDSSAPPKANSQGNGIETQAYEDIDKATTEAQLNRVKRLIDRDRANGFIGGARYDGVVKEIERKRAEIKAKFKVKEATPSEPGPATRQEAADEAARARAENPTTPHGRKTQAWKRLVQRDIRNATTERKLRGIETQIKNLLRDKRISDSEAKALQKQVDARRQSINGGGHTGLRRAMASIRRKVNAAPDGNSEKDLAEKVKARLIRDIAALKDKKEAEAWGRRGVAASDLNALRNFPGMRREINDAFKAKLRDNTIVPPSQPGVARAQAKANMPDSWKRKIGQIKGISDAEKLMDELEADKTIDNDEFNAVAEALNDYMEEVEAALELHEYLENGGDVFAAKSGAALWEVIQASKRFKVERVALGGVSGSWKVQDKQTGKTLFVKDTGGGADGAGKEEFAAAIGNAMGFMDHRARLGDVPTDGDGGGHVIIENAMDHMPDGARLIPLGKHRDSNEQVAARIARGPDPNSLMRMMLFDYIIANDEDRHLMNMHVVEEANGDTRAVLIDHGRAFGGMSSNYRVASKNARFAEWWPNYLRASARGWNARTMMQTAYPGGDMASAFDDIAKALTKRKIDAMVKQAVEQSGLKGKNADEYASLVRDRLTHLLDPKNRDEIIRAMGR